MSATKKSRKLILVIEGGWVIIGDVTRVGDTYTSKNSSVIRQWGTDAGLGQLALYGPRTETLLDPCGTVETDARNQVHMALEVVCDDKLWPAHIAKQSHTQAKAKA